MTTATAPTNGMALATTEYPKLTELTGFTAGQINLIRQTVATGCTIVEVAWYLYNAKRLELEPTLDQIYLIKYGNNPAEIVVGINGYRAQADSSGVYAGSDVAEFEYEDVGQPKRAPSKATVTVWKVVGGQRVPFTAEARWEEFYPGDGKAGEQYRKRPHNQLSVRAESHALRKAFPYQTGRLESREAAPAGWVEAAQADEAQRNSPERMKALAAQQVAIFGADEDGTAFADQPRTSSAVSSSAAGESTREPSGEAGGSRGSDVPVRDVTTKSHPLWRAWVDATAAAEAEELQYVDLALPISSDVLQASTASLLEMVASKRADV